MNLSLQQIYVLWGVLHLILSYWVAKQLWRHRALTKGEKWALTIQIFAVPLVGLYFYFRALKEANQRQEQRTRQSKGQYARLRRFH